MCTKMLINLSFLWTRIVCCLLHKQKKSKMDDHNILLGVENIGCTVITSCALRLQMFWGKMLLNIRRSKTFMHQMLCHIISS